MPGQVLSICSTDAKLLMRAVYDPNPVVFLEHELLYNEKFVLDEDENSIEIGKAKVLEEGNDNTIISFSRGLKLALDACKN